MGVTGGAVHAKLSPKGDTAVAGTLSGTQQKGTSGGPWLDAQGRLCGVQSGIMILNGALQGISFVAPADVVSALLKSKTHAVTPSLRIAVEETWQQPRPYLKKFPPRTEGLVVKVLPKDGASARAGLPHDVLIHSVDGQPVRLPDDFLNAVRMKSPGEEVQLVYQVPGEPETRNIAIALERLEQKWLPKVEK